MIKQIPNVLTVGRFILTVIFLVMVLYSPKLYEQGERPFPDFLDYAFIIFVVAGITDLIDGTIARSLGVTSKFGRIVDPLADKVLVCGTFICFAVIGEPKLFDFSGLISMLIPWSVAGIVILREFYVTVLRHIAEARGISFGAVFSGKLKMFIQSFAIGTVVMKMAHVQTATWGYRFTTITYLVMLAVTVASGIHATRRKSWKAAVKKEIAVDE
jgi:CDP-diacylglycerol--glycerol-3-phosphate 3-phosphatidyltransferase